MEKILLIKNIYKQRQTEKKKTRPSKQYNAGWEQNNTVLRFIYQIKLQ